MDALNYRPRRLRQSDRLRRLVAETIVTVEDLVYPLFVIPGSEKTCKEIPSMPGCFHHTIPSLVEEVIEVESLGIPAVILFGIPETKDDRGSGAYHKNGIVQRAVRAIKSKCKSIVVIADVCLCEYTSHGHCGVVDQSGNVLNDPTLELLGKTALSLAEAGVDVVAPSDMMDGRVGFIREVLDGHGFINTVIMSYAAKYCSAFYGPFRDAAHSAPQFGDRRSYQMDAPNAREALREIELDIVEGADIVMVKPALAYLDIITRAREQFPVPLAAYNVSGEYSMIKAAAKMGWLDEKQAMLEVLTAIKRAGADMILTYFAKEFALLKKGVQNQE